MVPKDTNRYFCCKIKKSLSPDHGHEVAEPDEDHEDPAGQTLAAVHAVCPLLDLASKRGCNMEHGTLVIRGDLLLELSTVSTFAKFHSGWRNLC